MKLGKDDPVLIIGASESGLMLALSLYYYGFTQVRVFDPHSGPTWPNIPLQLGPQLLTALSELELLGAVEKIGTHWEQAGVRLKSDRVFRHLDLDRIKESTGVTPLTVSAPALGQMLLDRLPAEWLDWDRDFISYTVQSKGVEAHFANGETITGALLVGADGFDSRVRLQMVGETPRLRTELYTWRALLSADQLVVSGEEEESSIALKSPVVEYLGRGCRAAYYQLKDGSAGIELTTYLPEEELAGEALSAHLSNTFSDFPRPIPALIERIAPEAYVGEGHSYREPLKHVYSGRVILLGKAAQPTLPYLGMEANVGMTDALVLGRLLEENHTRLERAFSLFERKRRKQIQRFQKAGSRYDRTISVRRRFGYAWRNLIYGFLSSKYTVGPFYKINLADAYSGK